MLGLVRWYMARNHVVSGAFVAAKMVPAIGEVCVRQAEHWNLSRVAMWLCRRLPQCGQTKPLGQRQAMIAARHLPSDP